MDTYPVYATLMVYSIYLQARVKGYNDM